MLNFYYNRICHLRIAQPIIKDINLLNSLLNNFSRKKAITTISNIVLKYQTYLDSIAIHLSGRPVVTGETNSLYNDITNDSLINDINYLVDCLVIIGAVKYGVVKSIEDAIENIF